MPEPQNLRDLEELARQRLPAMIYDYYAGGSGDEVTVRENETAWSSVRLRPRVLIDVSNCDLSTTVLGAPASMPLLTAPCALNTLAHSDGELAVARATGAAGIVQVASSISSYPLEEIAAASTGVKWFQLYCYRDRSITRDLVGRAEAAGYVALCLTVDVPMPGQRERDNRNRFKVPPHIRVANLAHLVPDTDEGSALLKYVGEQFDPSLTWEGLDWLRSVTRLPIVVKGVLTGEDARLAVHHGAAGVWVSNHGGRQLDTVFSTCDALDEVADIVAGDAEIFIDGGVRRGTDIFKALALGARAAIVGRPYLWGLAVDGEAGVRRVIEFLRDDLRLTMALSGCPTIGAITRAAVSRRNAR